MTGTVTMKWDDAAGDDDDDNEGRFLQLLILY